MPGWTLSHYEIVDSTQHVATELIAQGAPHRSVVVAERQTAGIGRKGDPWHDLPAASLLTTLILRPVRAAAIATYAMIAALAVVAAIRDRAHLSAGVKWPNDILIGDRKVAGILGDATWRGERIEAIRLGIGINVGGDRARYQHAGAPNATSITAEAGHDIDREAVLHSLLDHFARLEDQLNAGDDAAIIAAWRNAVVTVGAPVVVTCRDGRVLHGTATAVTDDGDLVLTANTAVIVLRATEVSSVRPGV